MSTFSNQEENKSILTQKGSEIDSLSHPNRREKLRPPEGTIWRGATITNEDEGQNY